MNPVSKVLCAIAAVALLFGAGYFAGIQHESAQWAAEKATQAGTKAAVTTAQTGVTQSVAVEAKAAETKIQTVYRDRVVVQTKEVPHEVVVRQDAGCVVPNRFVSVWNTANRLQVPDAAELLDERASGVVLSDIAAEHDAETQLAHSNAGKLILWQKWAREQCAITGQSGCDAIGAAEMPSVASGAEPVQ
ncbi:TPA: hypothetical protein QDB28_004008 [Burkholderia vietnamiensis]|nr:hypothetical protein [Burkholderia vietnamiensis]